MARASQRMTAVCVATMMVTATSCATTYDETRAPSTAAATTTVLPTGTTASLLRRLADQSVALSAVMIANGDSRGAAESIAALWAGARADVVDQRPDLVEGFDDNVAKTATAVQFKRAADADKAAKNIRSLVDAFGA
jgi:hypothetical protein